MYYFSYVKKSWHEAEQFCVSQGAHLASVTSEEEQVRVQPWGDVHGLGMGYGPRTRTKTSAHTQDHPDFGALAFLLLQWNRAEACGLLGQSGNRCLSSHKHLALQVEALTANLDDVLHE